MSLRAINYQILFILGLAICVTASGSGADRSKVQFKSWYPQYGFIFDSIVRNNCTDEYNTYLYGTKRNETIAWYNGSDTHTEFVEPLANCILDYTSQYILYQLQTAQIILGLTPT